MSAVAGTFRPARPPGTSAGASDRELLARHVPDVVMARSEQFRPTSVDGYVAACEMVLPDRARLGAVPLDELDGRWPAGSSLCFVTDGERRDRSWRAQRRRLRAAAPPRSSRVGLIGRLLGALFQLSVWFRPTLPASAAGAAAAKADTLGLPATPVCYGRVIQAGEWRVLHYAFFYVMNDWRTGYGGLNDHEGDWEQVWVFCDPVGDRPVWVAATSHDHRGPDLRRRWDDPEVLIRDGHPVLHAGGGSHALYVRPGHYVTRIDIPALRWVLRWQRWMHQRILRRRGSVVGLGPVLGVPFVDVADGQGEPIIIWDVRPLAGAPWAEDYRGLWGADPGDPLQGERGPGGPKFDRRGRVRDSWADPLGFVGLQGTLPPSAAASRLTLDRLDRALADLDRRIQERGRLLPLARQARRTVGPATEDRELTELLRQRVELESLRPRLAAGHWWPDGARDHLRHPARPLGGSGGVSWACTAWAALSIPLLLVLLAAVVLLDQLAFGAVCLLVLLALAPVDQLFRGRPATALGVTAIEVGVAVTVGSGPAVVALLGRYLAGGGLATAAVLLVAANRHELAAGGRPGGERRRRM